MNSLGEINPAGWCHLSSASPLHDFPVARLPWAGNTTQIPLRTTAERSAFSMFRIALPRAAKPRLKIFRTCSSLVPGAAYGKVRIFIRPLHLRHRPGRCWDSTEPEIWMSPSMRVGLRISSSNFAATQAGRLKVLDLFQDDHKPSPERRTNKSVSLTTRLSRCATSRSSSSPMMAQSVVDIL